HLSLTERSASAGVVEVHLVLVIADKYKWRFAVKLDLVSLNPDSQKRACSQHLYYGKKCCRPFAAAKSLLLHLSATKKARIWTYAGIIDKHAVVHLTNIDLGPTICPDDIHSFGNVQRDTQVSGKMI